MDQHAWNDRYSTTDLVWSAEPNRFFRETVEGLAPGRALDLGSGEGRNAIWLAEQGWAVTGVDFSDVAVKKGRRLAESRSVSVTWVVQDLLTYRPAPGAFDLVGLIYIHLTTDARHQVLRTAVGALAPGGRLVVLGHHSTNLKDGFGGPQDPSILFTPEDISADLKGLRVTRAESATRRVDAPDGAHQAIDALVVAVRPG